MPDPLTGAEKAQVTHLMKSMPGGTSQLFAFDKAERTRSGESILIPSASGEGAGIQVFTDVKKLRDACKAYDDGTEFSCRDLKVGFIAIPTFAGFQKAIEDPKSALSDYDKCTTRNLSDSQKALNLMGRRAFEKSAGAELDPLLGRQPKKNISQAYEAVIASEIAGLLKLSTSFERNTKLYEGMKLTSNREVLMKRSFLLESGQRFLDDVFAAGKGDVAWIRSWLPGGEQLKAFASELRASLESDLRIAQAANTGNPFKKLSVYARLLLTDRGGIEVARYSNLKEYSKAIQGYLKELPILFDSTRVNAFAVLAALERYERRNLAADQEFATPEAVIALGTGNVIKPLRSLSLAQQRAFELKLTERLKTLSLSLLGSGDFLHVGSRSSRATEGRSLTQDELKTLDQVENTFPAEFKLDKSKAVVKEDGFISIPFADFPTISVQVAPSGPKLNNVCRSTVNSSAFACAGSDHITIVTPTVLEEMFSRKDEIVVAERDQCRVTTGNVENEASRHIEIVREKILQDVLGERLYAALRTTERMSPELAAKAVNTHELHHIFALAGEAHADIARLRALGWSDKDIESHLDRLRWYEAYMYPPRDSYHAQLQLSDGKLNQELTDWIEGGQKVSQFASQSLKFIQAYGDKLEPKIKDDFYRGMNPTIRRLQSFLDARSFDFSAYRSAINRFVREVAARNFGEKYNLKGEHVIALAKSNYGILSSDSVAMVLEFERAVAETVAAGIQATFGSSAK